MRHICKNIFIQSIGFILLLAIILDASNQAFATNINSGETIFMEHCSGCHVNGGNIIRRGKTLKLSDLKRRGFDNTEAIAKIAREGIGSMSGYDEVLLNGSDQLVAAWVLNQAQNAWTPG